MELDSAGRCESTPNTLYLGSDRSAILVIALFVFAVLSVPKFNLSEVIVFAAFPLFLVNAAKLPPAMITRPLLRLSPFVLFMAAGNLFIDRAPMFLLSGLIVTGGMMSGAVIVAKTTIIVAGMLSVTLSIPFHRICRALATLHLPEVLITQLLLLYRFIEVLREEANSMQRARDIRSFGNKGKGILNTAALIGSLLLRTKNRAERLYRAMTARGFQYRTSKQAAAGITAGECLVVVLWGICFLSLRLIF